MDILLIDLCFSVVDWPNVMSYNSSCVAASYLVSRSQYLGKCMVNFKHEVRLEPTLETPGVGCSSGLGSVLRYVSTYNESIIKNLWRYTLYQPTFHRALLPSSSGYELAAHKNFEAHTGVGWTKQSSGRNFTALYIPITLTMGAVSSSETSVVIYRSTRHSIPGDSHLDTCRRDNLKSHIWYNSLTPG